MIIYRKQKLFGNTAAGIGAVTGLAGGAYLGNRIQAQYDYMRAKRKFDPEKTAEKEEKYAEEQESLAKKLRSDKDYMKRFKEAKKAQDKVYDKFKKGEADEWDLESADEDFYRKVPEGDVESIESSASTARFTAKDIRENPNKHRERAGKDAKASRKLNPGGTGTKIGAVVGALGGGLLGSKI